MAEELLPCPFCGGKAMLEELGDHHGEYHNLYAEDDDVFPLYLRPPAQDKDAERFFPPEFEVWQGDEMVAGASGPRDDAMREAMHYAAQYSQDGPVRVFEVVRTLITDAAMAAQQGEGKP